MTLRTKDRDRVATDISPFGAQDGLGDDLPNVIKNMLRELASRKSVPDDLDLSKYVIRNLCDQKEIGSVSLNIEGRLNAELSDYPFEARYETGLDIPDLQKKIREPQYSYPAVEVSLRQYNSPDYDVQPDKNGRARNLRVLVMAINHEAVLLYDPLRYGQVNSVTIDRIEATELDKQPFLAAWKGRFETTSSLWVEETEQQRLTKFNV